MIRAVRPPPEGGGVDAAADFEYCGCTPSHRNNPMNNEELSKEQRILREMRKTLGNIVKDTAPRPGRENPLSAETIQGIKDCFGLIAAREQELAQQLNFAPQRPYYSDGEAPAAKVVQFVKPGDK